MTYHVIYPSHDLEHPYNHFIRRIVVLVFTAIKTGYSLIMLILIKQKNERYARIIHVVRDISIPIY